MRYIGVELHPPPYHKDKEPIHVWAIHAREETPPPHEEAIEWFLLTKMGITSPEKAIECLRWRIED